jgi:hypothetical protein
MGVLHIVRDFTLLPYGEVHFVDNVADVDIVANTDVPWYGEWNDCHVPSKR